MLSPDLILGLHAARLHQRLAEGPHECVAAALIQSQQREVLEGRGLTFTSGADQECCEQLTCFWEGLHHGLAAALLQRQQQEVLKGQLAQVQHHVERQPHFFVPEVHQDDLLLVRARLQQGTLL